MELSFSGAEYSSTATLHKSLELHREYLYFGTVDKGAVIRKIISFILSKTQNLAACHVGYYLYSAFSSMGFASLAGASQYATQSYFIKSRIASIIHNE